MAPSLTLYEQFLSLPFLVQFLCVAVPAFVIAIALTLYSLRKDGAVRSDDNVATAGLRFVGAAFIFIGAFAIVTGWQGSSLATTNLVKEFAAATTVAEHVIRTPSPEGDAIVHTLREYAQTVKDTELGADGLPGYQQDAEDLIVDLATAVQQFEELPILSQKQNEALDQALGVLVEARHTRVSAVWPLVPASIFTALVVIAVMALLAVGLYPAGARPALKWLQALGSTAIIVTVISTVLVVQVTDDTSDRYNQSVDLFISYYAGY
jgi:hypothetical protein